MTKKEIPRRQRIYLNGDTHDLMIEYKNLLEYKYGKLYGVLAEDVKFIIQRRVEELREQCNMPFIKRYEGGGSESQPPPFNPKLERFLTSEVCKLMIEHPNQVLLYSIFEEELKQQLQISDRGTIREKRKTIFNKLGFMLLKIEGKARKYIINTKHIFYNELKKFDSETKQIKLHPSQREYYFANYIKSGGGDKKNKEKLKQELLNWKSKKYDNMPKKRKRTGYNGC